MNKNKDYNNKKSISEYRLIYTHTYKNKIKYNIQEKMAYGITRTQLDVQRFDKIAFCSFLNIYNDLLQLGFRRCDYNRAVITQGWF